MGKTAIEWATHTENYQAGCDKVSEACKHCYAIPQSARIERMGGPDRYTGVAVHTAGTEPRWTGTVNPDRDALTRMFQGLHAARNPRRVFVNSMTDTFHESLPVDDGILMALAEEIEGLQIAINQGEAPEHVLMLLTKRPERMAMWAARWWAKPGDPTAEGAEFPTCVWAGTTVETQQRANERIPHLLAVPASVRFVSCEPLLGAVDLTRIRFEDDVPLGVDALAGAWTDGPSSWGGAALHWVIAGGESGPKARPSHPDWFRGLRDQCRTAGVAFHFKQWGAWLPSDVSAGATMADPDRYVRLGVDGVHYHPACGDVQALARVGKKAAGRELDGVTYSELPFVQPTMSCPSCGRRELDFDGFGMLAHVKPAYPQGCGYCTHPAIDGGVCSLCGVTFHG